MESQFIDFTRRQLDRRLNRAMSGSPYHSFWRECRLLVSWIGEHPLLGSIIQSLRMRSEGYQTRMLEVAAEFARCKRALTNEDYIITDSFEEQAAVAWAGLRILGMTIGEPHTGKIDAVCRMMTNEQPSNQARQSEVYREFVLTNIRDYLEENLDRRDVTLYLLSKYKRKCEWFWRKRLREEYALGFEGERAGERSLAIHLYDYLHDQGLEFHIEPAAPDGWVDALADEWAIDAKLIKDNESNSSIKHKLASGFRQVADYCNAHNRAVGYLVVYRAKDILIDMPLDVIDGCRHLRLGGRIIYYSEIDITEYSHPASHRGAAQILTLSSDDLLNPV